MKNPRSHTPLRELKTYGRSRAPRHADCTYAADELIHVTICAFDGKPFDDAATAKFVCENVEFYCEKLRYRLYGYCLMPDHLHVLLSPNDSGIEVSAWLNRFKSYTTHLFMKQTRRARLWQKSAYDHICRGGETAESALAYIVDNPVRAGLVKCWQEWSWTKVFIEV